MTLCEDQVAEPVPGLVVKCPEQIQKAEGVVSGAAHTHSAHMGLQKVHRRAGEDTEAHRENAMKTERPRLELHSCKLRNTKDCLNPSEARHRQAGTPLQVSEGAWPC